MAFSFRMNFSKADAVIWAFGDFEEHIGLPAESMVGLSLRDLLGREWQAFQELRIVVLSEGRNRVQCFPVFRGKSARQCMVKLVLTAVIFEGEVKYWMGKGYWIEDLYRRLTDEMPSVSLYVERKCEPNLREDVTQSTLAIAMDSIEDFDGLTRMEIRSKLGGIAMRRVRAERRKLAKLVESSKNNLPELAKTVETERPSDRLKIDEDVDAVADYLDEMDSSERAVVRLRLLTGATWSEVASAAGWSIGRVRRTVAKAIKGIRGIWR